jgi:two-component system cell cycle response regulator
MVDDIAHLLGTLKGIAPTWTSSPPPPYYLNPNAVIEDLQKQAHTDKLTGLPNRAAFLSAVDHEVALAERNPDRKFCIVSLDLDGLKSVNDGAGHAAGDFLIQEFVRLFQDGLRDTDVLARVGGDELWLLAPEATEDGLAPRLQTLSEKIRQTPLTFEKTTMLGLGVSYGIAQGSGKHDFQNREDAIASLMEVADTRMYAMKAKNEKPHPPFCPLPM